jgi:DNA polymerase III subunit delta
MGKKAASSGSVEFDPAMRIVVLHGKERFLIEEHTRRFAGMLDEHFGGVEQFTFDGQAVSPAAVLDELRSYGLMQKHKLVILDNAEDFLAGGGKNAAANEDDDDEGGGSDESEKSTRRPMMEKYAESPVPDATLLMRASTWRAGKLDKLIAKAGALYECKPISEDRAARWCGERCAKRYGTTINPDAAELLVARLGPELQHLDTELLKLASMAGPGKPITRALVAESVGLSREEKAWEIQSAIVTANANVMLTKLRELLDISRHDVVPITWAICDLVRKLHAASQLLGRNVPRAGVIGQLRLWGPSTEPIMALAGRVPPRTFAQLLRDAIEMDQRNKSGRGDQQRNVEAWLVHFADTISR